MRLTPANADSAQSVQQHPAKKMLEGALRMPHFVPAPSVRLKACASGKVRLPPGFASGEVSGKVDLQSPVLNGHLPSLNIALSKFFPTGNILKNLGKAFSDLFSKLGVPKRIDIEVGGRVTITDGKHLNPSAPSDGKSADASKGADFSGDDWKNVQNLPSPCSFEDFIAAFMMDVVKQQQDDIKATAEKLKNLTAAKKNAPKEGAEGAKKGGNPLAPGGASAQGGVGGFLGGALKGGLSFRGVLGMVRGMVQMGSKVAGMLGPKGQVIAMGLQMMDGLSGPLAEQFYGAIDNMLGLGGKKSAAASSGDKTPVGEDGKPLTKQDIEESRQMLMEEMKNSMNKLQQMQQALSNVLNAMHQGSMNAIRNIK